MTNFPSSPQDDQAPSSGAGQVEALLARASQLEQQDWASALLVLCEALTLARQQEDQSSPARVLLQLATLEWRLSKFDSAQAHASEALQDFRRRADQHHEAWCLRLLGNIHGVQGQYVAASELLQASAALSRETGNRTCLASCLNNLGIIANELGDYASGLEYLLEALKTYDEHDLHVPSTLNNIATHYRQLGQHASALEHHEQALERARSLGAHGLTAAYIHNMAETLRQSDRHEQAMPLLEESLTLARQIGDRQTELLALDSLGQTHQALGAPELARQCYEEGLRLAPSARHPLAEVKLLMHHASLQPEGRREMLEQSLRLSQDKNLRAELLEAHDLLARFHREAGEFRLALEHLEQARAVERELFNEAQDHRTQALQIQYDLARTRASNEAQRQLNEQLRRANEELDAFSYTISHDLRAPVRHIKGFVGLLRSVMDTDAHPKSGRYLNVIEDSTDRLNNLIDAMLNFARQSQEPLQLTQVDLGQLVGSLQAELAAQVQDQRVCWQIGSLPVVQGDFALLRQVMINLLSNALKYSRPRDESVVEVWAERQGAVWAVHVRDNGVGFDPQYADKLFGVFQRLHRQDEFEGTGVGLATVQRIVIRHGGEVSATSQGNEGATFTFTLPA
ncbi:tetratricopeptide repeat protein [Deinococcus deserti]|uniref:histidine kinase n=1 Tax=Deinococcus deserti (strain DSM 17065 / CIP 109153 / LMG 22923 / VCD115) TaxID=546414 RepID=C1CZT4_DEIDV|nr:tetratricopeptide repeat protein [Deinococcus deserti]ACO45186.1 putative histidine kinase, classic [Deinococcus deserti VCD115]